MTSFFRRPLGLVLSGGGALGAWQAAALARLEREGLAFDSVLGFSAGALTGLYYFLGRMPEALERWRRRDMEVLRFRPRLFPFSLFSDEPVREALACAVDDEAAKRAARCRLVVVCAGVARDEAVYAVYTPGGRDGWDAPLLPHLMASCAIPVIFPQVDVPFSGKSRRLFDGGVPCARPMSFEALGECRDVLVLDVVRPEEADLRPRGLLAAVDHKARQTMRHLIGQGLDSLRARPEPPRIFRLGPSRILGHKMLDFHLRERIDDSLALGDGDARALLESPQRYAA